MTITYDTAAALAITAADLADAVDDQRPDAPALAEKARALLDMLTSPPWGSARNRRGHHRRPRRRGPRRHLDR